MLPPLTAEQRAVVDHPGSVIALGSGATGKTTALVARYLRLVSVSPPSRILVLCRSRVAATRFRDAVLPQLAGGFDALPVTTVHGYAFDLVTRLVGEVRLLTATQQRREVEQQLQDDGPGPWPTLQPLLDRRAFVDEAAGAVLDVQASLATPDDVRDRAATAGVAERWAELFAFAERYQRRLRDAGCLDTAGLLVRATELLDGGTAAAYDHVLVDDLVPPSPVTAQLVSLVAAACETTAIATLAPVGTQPRLDLTEAASFALTKTFHEVAVPERVVCQHPSAEPEAVAGELLAAHAGGVPWQDMAVLVRSPARQAAALARAMARHGVPVVHTPDPENDPTVRSLLDMLRWVNGDAAALERLLSSPVSGLDAARARQIRQEAREREIPLESHEAVAPLVAARDELARRAPREDLAALAFDAWEMLLGHLVSDAADDRSLDAVVSMLDGAAGGPDLEPDLWRVTRLPAADAVTVTSIAAATGCRWHTVVVAGCVEGELPRIRTRQRYFDRALLRPEPPPTVAQRRRQVLDDERQLFCDLARTRATYRLVAVAAPEPGVLTSRFIAGWEDHDAARPPAVGLPPVGRVAPAASPQVVPGDVLPLSATKLETYADCPLRFAYHYGVHVRDEGSVYLDLGSLVHDILATFCDPETTARDYSWEALREIANERWRDDIATYRPQVEEARRDLFDMLERWWASEGHQRPEVLAVEREFAIEVAGHEVRGKIDRIDRAPDGGIRILDYKTGRREPRKGEAADNIQLAIYHLAAERDPDLKALGSVSQLDLMFLRTMNVHEQPVVADHAAQTETQVATVAEHILAGDFEPSVTADCRTCIYHRLCPLQPEGREVGAA